jgi:hypothetical protein
MLGGRRTSNLSPEDTVSGIEEGLKEGVVALPQEVEEPGHHIKGRVPDQVHPSLSAISGESHDGRQTTMMSRRKIG